MFTPILGLYDTLHHGRLATLNVKTDLSQDIFDYTTDGLNVTFFDAWKPFRINHISEFPEMPMLGVLLLMGSLCVMHIFAFLWNLKVLLGEKINAGLLMQGLHSFIAPPLQYDWDLLYQEYPQNGTLHNCWRR